jgi:hypothetical protein
MGRLSTGAVSTGIGAAAEGVELAGGGAEVLAADERPQPVARRDAATTETIRYIE